MAEFLETFIDFDELPEYKCYKEDMELVFDLMSYLESFECNSIFSLLKRIATILYYIDNRVDLPTARMYEKVNEVFSVYIISCVELLKERMVK